MKTRVLCLFILLGLASSFQAAPYALINDHWERHGCHYWKVTIWDDNGTPHDTSDDSKIVTDTMNDCDDPPINRKKNARISEDSFNAIVSQSYSAVNSRGDSCQFYKVELKDGQELNLVQKLIVGNCR